MPSFDDLLEDERNALRWATYYFALTMTECTVPERSELAERVKAWSEEFARRFGDPFVYDIKIAPTTKSLLEAEAEAVMRMAVHLHDAAVGRRGDYTPAFWDEYGQFLGYLRRVMKDPQGEHESPVLRWLPVF